MHTLYIGAIPVFIGNPEELQTLNIKGSTHLEEPDGIQLSEQLSALKNKTVSALQIRTQHPDQILENIKKEFQHWEAAGGLIRNKAGDLLLLFRRNKWDLPKGKVEPGEHTRETALREVREETGLKNIQIVKKLTETWHSYPVSVYGNEKNEDSRDILKQTFWYLMDFTGEELTVPQIEEDIMDIQWIKPSHIKKYLIYSYPNIQTVFEAAGYL